MPNGSDGADHMCFFSAGDSSVHMYQLGKLKRLQLVIGMNLEVHGKGEGGHSDILKRI